MEKFLAILTLAVLTEALTEILKPFLPSVLEDETYSKIVKGISIVFGVVVCLTTQTNIFEALNITMLSPIIGMILTGLLISRGSNYISDLLGKVNKIKEDDVQVSEIDMEKIGFNKSD